MITKSCYYKEAASTLQRHELHTLTMAKGTRREGREAGRTRMLTDFIQTDVLDLPLVHRQFQSRVEGAQGTVDLTLRED